MRFIGKTVIITGAGSGIGAETARRFATEGANVVVADINYSAAHNVAETLTGALAVEVDVTSRMALRDMVTQTIDQFGGIDILINNAMTCSESPFLEMSVEEVQRDVAVNALGPFFACQEVIPWMIKGGGGVVLNMTSVNGLSYFGNEAYSLAKAGVINLTKSIASQFGQDGIRCNAVAPGTVATPAWEHRMQSNPKVLHDAVQWYPLGRVGLTSDIADALLFLASEAAAWISGVTLPVDGGLLSGNLAMSRAIIPQSKGPTTERNSDA